MTTGRSARDRVRDHWAAAAIPQADEDLAFEADAARSEFQHALTQIDLRHRKLELDHLRGRLSSKEDLVAFQEKNLAYKRLQGALPSA